MGLREWLRQNVSFSLWGPPRPTIPPGTSSLSGLLDALDEIAQEHTELLDSDVRKRLWQVIERRYVKLDATYEIPQDLGMASEAGNRRLRAALAQHLGNLIAIAEAFRLDSEAKRLRTLLNPAVRSEPHGHTYDYFFAAP
ncbi:hypothetical protein JXQ70_06755 [bacterium]|nr:hypothetical protein [bacterium]